ncbi:WecB/TagA/CpsF family glycosyltransferase [Roseomonas chloroacetimidivorans]|uniref:WecB/TagA/CpsF family glycosyltransferase n=1 Tax=Roseomonas chloroacetimidivorans TaxID=1766656 RepID=UPI003C7772D8
MTPRLTVAPFRQHPARFDVPGRRLLSVHFDDVSPKQALDRIAARDPQATFAYVLAPRPGELRALERRPEMRRIQKDAWLSLCGNADLRSLAAQRGVSLMPTTAQDLADLLFERVIKPDTPVTVVGGAPGTVQCLRAKFGLTRLAHCLPPSGTIRDAISAEACFQFIRDNPARFVLICRSSPWQEILAARIAADGRATGLGLCLGSALDDMAGIRSRIPAWIRSARWDVLRHIAARRTAVVGGSWRKGLAQGR